MKTILEVAWWDDDPYNPVANLKARKPAKMLERLGSGEECMLTYDENGKVSSDVITHLEGEIVRVGKKLIRLIPDGYKEVK